MKKILSLITIMAMMLCLFACETEQSGSADGTEQSTTTTVQDQKGGTTSTSSTTSTTTTTSTTVVAGAVIKLTLDSQEAKTVGTKQIYLKYGDGYYFERSCETKIGLKSNPIECPTKTGCIFKGYNADKDGKGQAVLTENGYLDVDAGFDNFTSDTTLYALWEKIAVYEIKYNETKGAMNTNVRTFTESDNVTLNKNIAADGYTFLGWFDASTDGREVTGWTAGHKTADVNLWAYWKANTYTVDLTNDGVTIGTLSVTATYNANLPNITIPTKTGFQFAGYYTAANGVGTKYIDKDGKGCQLWNIANNTTLYADWLENDGHFITYNGADGCDNSANKDTFKESQTVTIYNITKTGYSFGGWWTQAEGGTRVTGWAAGEKTDNIVLYARWTANEYTVTLTSNGTTTGTKSITATFGETVPDITIPTKTGSQFLGYYAGENGIGTKYIDENGNGCHIWNIADNATLYADWQEKTHSITYNGADDCDNPNDTTFKESQPVTIQNISKTGYIFNGWYDDENGGTKVTGWAIGAKTDNVILYARWTPIIYTVAYYANGGSGSILPQSFTYDEAQTLTACTFTAPTGMKFGMWNTQADGLGLPYTDGQSVSNLAAENNATVKLYAQWVDKTHSIKYNNIKTADNGLNIIVFREGQSVTLSDLSLAGWIFDGWYSEENGGSKVTGWNAGTKTADVEVWARWTIQTYTITYNNVENSVNPNQTTFTIEDNVSLSDITRTGYTFNGWWTESDDGTQLTGWDNSMMIDNVTVWAKWTPNTYSITYRDKGGNPFSGTMTDYPQIHTYGTVTTLVSPTKNGMVFGGWFDIESCVGDSLTEIDAETYTNNITLYAVWQSHECQAEKLAVLLESFDSNSGPYKITITDSNPDLSVIKTALTSNSSIRVDLDLSNCSTLTTIGYEAFKGCTSLTNITIPNTINRIERGAFTDCSGLSEPVYNDNIFAYMPKSYSGSYSIPEGITIIAERAFDSCNNMTEIEIPNSVTSICQYAFSSCNELTSIIIKSNASFNASTDAGLYFIKDKIRYHVINKNYVDIVANNYSGDIVIPSTIVCGNTFSVNGIENYAFYNRTGLTSVTIPNSVTSIGNQAFYQCKGLTTMIVLATTPPRYGNQMLVTWPSEVTIYVPSTSVDAYKNSIGWKDHNITAIE